MKQKLLPRPGRVAVVREKASAFWGEAQKIHKLEDDQKWETRSNPFAMVVGVGDAFQTDYGTTIKTDLQDGDKVIAGQSGMWVPLRAGADDVDFVYVLPFEGVIARIEAECEVCGWQTRTNVETQVCDQCGAGAAPELVAPTLAEVSQINAKR